MLCISALTFQIYSMEIAIAIIKKQLFISWFIFECLNTIEHTFSFFIVLYNLKIQQCQIKVWIQNWNFSLEAYFHLFVRIPFVSVNLVSHCILWNFNKYFWITISTVSISDNSFSSCCLKWMCFRHSLKIINIHPCSHRIWENIIQFKYCFIFKTTYLWRDFYYLLAMCIFYKGGGCFVYSHMHVCVSLHALMWESCKILENFVSKIYFCCIYDISNKILLIDCPWVRLPQVP